jgi:hypothetical protein
MVSNVGIVCLVDLPVWSLCIAVLIKDYSAYLHGLGDDRWPLAVLSPFQRMNGA